MIQREVLCIGEAMAMLTDADSAVEPLASGLEVHVGGAEANVARHLSAQGIRAGWASRVGDDPFGELVRRTLVEDGVDTSLVVVDSDAHTGLYYKERRNDGGARVHYYRAGSAASRLDPDDAARFLQGLGRPSVVHLSGIVTALSDSAAAFVDTLLSAASDAGTTISFDVNYRPQLWSDLRAPETLLGLAQRADVVFVGRDEAEALWGTPTVEEVLALVSDPGLVVVKDGDVEAVERDRRGPEARTTIARPAAVDVVELVGAGDAFAGGYLAGLVRGESAASRLHRGHRAAAWTIGGIEDVRPGHLPDPFRPDEG